MRIVRLFALCTFLGCLVGCSEIPGSGSQTAQAFEENAADVCEGTYEDCTPSEAIEVLDLSTQETSPGSHADLNAAKVAPDKGENKKAVDHLLAFRDKVEKEYGKKVPEDDADFMLYTVNSILAQIDIFE